MKKITDFDTQSKSYTGGVTGSSRVRGLNDNNHYQLKPSILVSKASFAEIIITPSVLF